MRRFAITAALGAAALGLAGCGDYDEEAEYNAEGNAAYGADGAGNAGYGAGADGGNAAYGATAATELPAGTRVVVEEGVRYRIDPDGTRVRIEGSEPVIVVEEGARFRIDPDGTRVRIGPDGAAIDVDGDVDADVRVGDDPSLEVNVNDR